jgi:hypothetical protein
MRVDGEQHHSGLAGGNVRNESSFVCCPIRATRVVGGVLFECMPACLVASNPLTLLVRRVNVYFFGFDICMVAAFLRKERGGITEQLRR